MFAYLKWPKRLDKCVEGAPYYKDNNVRYDFPMRFNGFTPFDWENCKATYDESAIGSISGKIRMRAAVIFWTRYWKISTLVSLYSLRFMDIK